MSERSASEINYPSMIITRLRSLFALFGLNFLLQIVSSVPPISMLSLSASQKSLSSQPSPSPIEAPFLVVRHFRLCCLELKKPLLLHPPAPPLVPVDATRAFRLGAADPVPGSRQPDGDPGRSAWPPGSQCCPHDRALLEDPSPEAAG